MAKRIVLVVVGLLGSGKSTAVDSLKRHGFEVIELGDIWRELLKKNNIPRSDPIATREFTLRIRETEGMDIYAKYAFKKIRKSSRKVAITGLRSTYEMEYLRRKIKGIKIIALVAPLNLRFKRFALRDKPEDPKSMKDFKWLENREKRGFMKAKSEEKHGVMHIIEQADYVIANTSTISELHRDMLEVIRSIEAEKG